MNSALCIDCHLRMDVCLCAYAPCLQIAVQIKVLMHPSEWQKTSNTARLLQHCGVADIVHWQRPLAGTIERLLPELPHGCSVALLFPEDCAAVGAALFNGPGSRASTGKSLAAGSPSSALFSLIVLDGTWQQVRKMYRQSSALQALPLFCVNAAGASEYTLRKGQADGHMSTVEAVVAVLQALGDGAAAAQLYQYFQRFLHHYEAHRSGHQQIRKG